MTYETRPRWTGQGQTMCPEERRRRFGPVQPMQRPGWWQRFKKARAALKDSQP